MSEYVRLCGYKNGGDRKSEGQNGLLKLSEIAKQLGLSEKSLKRVLSIERNLTDSMKEFLDTDGIPQTFASDMIELNILVYRNRKSRNLEIRVPVLGNHLNCA